LLEKKNNIIRILLVFFQFFVNNLFADENKPSKIEIDNLYLIEEASGLFLNGDVSVTLEETLIKALGKGLSLNFSSELEVYSLRKILPDKMVKKVTRNASLTYHGITRRYNVSLNEKTIYFESLTQALAMCLGLKRWVRFTKEELINKKLRVRLRLDVDSLPKPLSLVAVSDPAWQLTTGWVVVSDEVRGN